VDLEKTMQAIEELQGSILEMAPSAPGGEAAMTWPVGSQAANKPANRFDVLQWDYFTESQIFPESDFGAVKQLTGADKIDIQVGENFLFNFY
jgi:hypothetical protein